MNDYLFTAGTDQIINIYNMKTTIIEREMNCKKDGFSGLTGILKLGQADKELVITDEFFGVTWMCYDLDNPLKDYPDIGYKPVTKLFPYVSNNPDIFATTNDMGLIKVWLRSVTESEDEVSVEVQEFRKFRGHKGAITSMSHFNDGSFVSGGSDGTYRIWTSRNDVMKIGNVETGKGGCCGTGSK